VTLTTRRAVLRTIGHGAWIAAVLMTAACENSPTGPSTSVGTFTKTDFITGTGAEAATNSSVVVNYAGWLYDTSKPDGKGAQFDANAGFSVALGTGAVIKGWDEGIPGMRVGGQRRLIIPPELAYGSADRGSIPANATLVFDIALMSITEPTQ
jgi:FKBP-type peptidyl-prolyl cis-trans isomerase FkpA